jgi:hypothetical protein
MSATRPSFDTHRVGLAALGEGPTVDLVPVLAHDWCSTHRMGVLPMKKLLLVLLVLGVAAAIAYLLGTESGRARRDDIVSRVRKTSEVDREPEIDLTDTAGKAEEISTKTARELDSAIGTSG